VTPVRDSAAEARAAALAAMQHAYAPYSHFRVGAALRATDGTVVAGCNVENAAFPSGTCAERGALAAAVATGHRNFDLLVVATDAGDPTPPCGMCRQALMEFSPALRVLAVTTGGKRVEWMLSDLLPQPFTPASLSNT
jgi:cytidine deaminase